MGHWMSIKSSLDLWFLLFCFFYFSSYCIPVILGIMVKSLRIAMNWSENQS